MVALSINETKKKKPLWNCLKNTHFASSTVGFLNAIAILITSFIAYLLWLGARFIIIELFGSDFDFDDFIGEGQGYAYFLPFMLGAVILILNYFVIPALTAEIPLLLVKYLRGVIQFLAPTSC